MSRLPTPDATVIDLDAEDSAADTGPAIAADSAAGVVDEDADEAAALPRGAVQLPDGTIRLKLRHPVTLTVQSATRGRREETYAELTFHRLVGADIRAIAAASAEQRIIVLLAKASSTREAVMRALFDRMDAADISAAASVCERFFGSGQTTGR